MEKFLINDQRLKINGYPVQPLSIIAHLNYCIFRSVIISVEIDFKDSHLLFIQTFQYLKELLFSSFLKAPQEAKADAKIMPLFHSFQIFQKLFLNFFSVPTKKRTTENKPGINTYQNVYSRKTSPHP